MAACTAASAAAVAAAVATLTAIFCMRTALDLAAPIIDDLDFRADDLFFAIRLSAKLPRSCLPLVVCGKNAAMSALFHCIANYQVTANVLDLATGGRHNGKEGIKKLENLFHDTLKDIYFAEKKILATLPKMEKAAQSAELKSAFAKHRKETEGHVARLEEVFAAIDKRPQGKTCDAIIGITTDEGAEIMKEYKGSPALDAGLLAAAQAVEH